MRQLPLGVRLRDRASFASFVAGANAEAVRHVTELAGGGRSGCVWLHGPDSYEGILGRVLHGIPKAWTTRGVTMPMRGWSTLSDAQARDVAAYVWQVSHAWMVPARRKPS